MRITAKRAWPNCLFDLLTPPDFQVRPIEVIEIKRASELAAEEVAFLAQLGFSLEAFGGSTWTMRETPRGLSPEQAEECLRTLLDRWQQEGIVIAAEVQESALDVALSEIAACLTADRGQRDEELLAALQRMGVTLEHLTAPLTLSRGAPTSDSRRSGAGSCLHT